MKLMKMLGLAVIAAITAMALAGAGTASAGVLCSENEVPCAGGNVIPAESSVELSLEDPEEEPPEQQVTLTTGFGGEVSCQASTMSITITKNPGEPQILGQVVAATFGECQRNGGGECTVKAVQLPWEVHIDQAEPKGNGTVWLGPKPGKKLAPGIELTECGAFSGCVYKGDETQPKYESEWIRFDFTGGKQPTVTAAGSAMSSNFLCGAGSSLSAEYHVVSPKPLWVVQAK